MNEQCTCHIQETLKCFFPASISSMYMLIRKLTSYSTSNWFIVILKYNQQVIEKNTSNTRNEIKLEFFN